MVTVFIIIVGPRCERVAMFSYLPNFHIINGIPVDYMHGVLLGVTKSLLNF